MFNFQKPRQTKDIVPENEDAMEHYQDNIYLLQNRESEESDESDDKWVSHGHKLYKPKRHAKDTHLMQQDIFNIYKEKDKWTWDEIKDLFSDQPEAPLKAAVLELCDKVPGCGMRGQTEYALKSTYKM